MDWLLILLLIVIVILVGWVIRLGYEILESMHRLIDLLRRWPPRGHHHPNAALTNYCTWTYRGSVWEIAESRVEPGFVPGESPRRPGAYEGETVRRPAVRGA